jgi:hypothetical protein
MSRELPAPLRLEVKTTRWGNSKERAFVQVLAEDGTVLHSAQCYYSTPEFQQCLAAARTFAQANVLKAIAEEYRDLLQCTAETPEALEDLRRIQAALEANRETWGDDVVEEERRRS